MANYYQPRPMPGTGAQIPVGTPGVAYLPHAGPQLAAAGYGRMPAAAPATGAPRALNPAAFSYGATPTAYNAPQVAAGAVPVQHGLAAVRPGPASYTGAPTVGHAKPTLPAAALPGGPGGAGQQVSVWSNSSRCWCPGRLDAHLAGGALSVRFQAPNGEWKSKVVAPGIDEVRPLDGASNVTLANAAPSTGRLHIVVDEEEDVVNPSTGHKRIAHLSGGALHGDDLATSPHEHGLSDAASASFGFRRRPHASAIANDIIERVLEMSNVVAQEGQDVLDKQWAGPGGSDPLSVMFNGQTDPRVIGQQIEQLAMETAARLQADATLVEKDVPANVFGDLHGQFRDMLLFLHHYGFPGDRSPTFVFNGDWVDRGHHQLEVVILVFALKAVFPDKVVLLRGNHEDPHQNRSMGAAGFEQQCNARLGQDVGPRAFELFHQAFEQLPMACVVGGKILCVHGGIGEGTWDLDHVRRARRPLNHDSIPQDPVLYNMLWSDPIPDDPGAAEDHFGIHGSPRDGYKHLIVTFGKDTTDAFCKRTGLEMIVRSHQALVHGFGYDVMHGGRLVRVFSARDYEGQGNDGAILSVSQGVKSAENPTDHLLVRLHVLRSLEFPKQDS
eukprot:TRINITY_DN57295_c0_g1_i1.p1 TRINITY_DN57295_c0_g1~~TRINITY_DN57295_c0_g1_i1.p1  ORF type:complete len:627 (+),score=64.87 TRINITY_DN57295_c0_g1_i1:48-1883(+)